MSKTPELMPCPHDGSKVEFCEECDGGCHRIIGNGMEIDLLPSRQNGSLENRRAICAKRWNTRVYPAEVHAAIERDKTVKPINKDQFGVSVCPKCKADAQEYQDYCFRCGQRLGWSEE